MLLIYGGFFFFKRDIVINHLSLLNILVSLVRIKSNRNEA